LLGRGKIIIYNKLFFLVIVSAAFLCAQGNKSQNQFSGFSKGYFSGTYSLYPSFVEAVNDEVEDFGVDKFDENVFLYGGELCGNMNPEFGISIQYFTGIDLSTKIVEGFTDENGDLILDGNNNPLKLDRAVRYNMSFFGLGINYRKSLFGAFEFFGAVSGGYGDIELILSQDYGDQSFGDLWESFDPGSYLDEYNRSVDYNSGLFIFSANNGLRMFVSSRIALGITAGYTYGLVSDTGEINFGFESVKNIPDLDFEGMNYSLGIYFGY